jgi:transcriptional regulator with XRE-family HTH domain
MGLVFAHYEAMKLNAVNLGIRIKQARTAKGWTQTELAKALGVQRSSVVRWETGVSVARKIPQLSKVLGQTAEWFLERADEVATSAVSKDSQEMKQLRGEVRRLQKELRSSLTEKNQSVAQLMSHADVEERVERAIRNERARAESVIEPKSVTVNIINEKAQPVEKQAQKNEDKIEKHVEVKAKKSRKSEEHVVDQAILAEILKSWNGVTEEARLMAALLITGDWSYKLKLWNRNIAVGDDVLKSIRHKGKKSRISNRIA